MVVAVAAGCGGSLFTEGRRREMDQDLLIANNFAPLQIAAQSNVIGTSLLAQLETFEESMEADIKRLDKGLVVEARSNIEQNLIALAFLVLLAIWMPPME
jgi:hypothetical protein